MKIVLRESGGLGNQLFQYAALRYYATRYGAEMHIAVDPEWNAFSYGYPRPCLLHHFSIPAHMAERSFCERVIFSAKPWLNCASLPFKKLLGIQVFDEPIADRYTFLRDLPLKQGVRALYIGGYYENCLIVEEIAAQLRVDLTFRRPPENKTRELMEKIRRSKTAVSLHVRRGDAVIPAEGKVILQREYYANAVALMKKSFVDPTFFVFSDDIPFVRKNLLLDPKTVFVDHNDTFTAHEDLRLMSSCHHHIIANSTFSWWAAWLNPRSDKIVMGPKRWYLEMNRYNPNLLPRGWILADSAAS